MHEYLWLCNTHYQATQAKSPIALNSFPHKRKPKALFLQMGLPWRSPLTPWAPYCSGRWPSFATPNHRNGALPMPYQNISADLSTADLNEIKAALATIQQKLPFLVNLTAEERRRLYKMGDKSLAFVSNSLTAAQNNPDVLPASFDTAELARDYQLATVLSELRLNLRQMTEQVDDTLLAVGSEAMTSSLSVYDYVKAAAKRQPGLKAVAAQLGERFKSMRQKAEKVEVMAEARP